MTDAPVTLDVAVARLVNRIAYWTPARWSKPVSSGNGTRADAVHALVQQLADAGARASGEPVRTVPRLENVLVLPDQLRVVTSDVLVSANAELLETTTSLVRATAAAL